MPAAARVEDPITHTRAFSGLLAGVVVGAVVGAAIVGTGGAAAPLLLASAACTGGALGGLAGELLGGLSTSTAGRIVDGSTNVRINRRPAAFCTSEAACDKHSGPVVVAQGSSTVRINGRAAARTGDKGSCGFAVGPGSPNVNIGGAPAACAAAASEVPGWANTMLFVLGLAGPGFGLRAGGMALSAIAARRGSGSRCSGASWARGGCTRSAAGSSARARGSRGRSRPRAGCWAGGSGSGSARRRTGCRGSTRSTTRHTRSRGR